jgi:hypothetical protein
MLVELCANILRRVCHKGKHQEAGKMGNEQLGAFVQSKLTCNGQKQKRPLKVVLGVSDHKNYVTVANNFVSVIKTKMR